MSIKRTLFSAALAAFTAASCFAASSARLDVFAAEKQNLTQGDDIKQLKKLALSTGWEFAPNQITNIYLKDLGVNRIRCINIDKFPGEFDEKGHYRINGPMNTRLDHHLQICADIGAIPHLVIGPSMPEALLRQTEPKETAKGIMGNVGISGRVYGPSDYKLYRNYFVAVFEYIIIEKGLTTAVFETFNEPDIGGGFIYETPKVPGRGSKEAYDNLLKNYRIIAEAAAIFEQRHPGHKVVLGGPALAWAYTFKFGAFNWGNRFVEDCAKNNLKLDFVGVHYYGNISPISGETQKEYNAYPSFLKMVDEIKASIAKHNPGLPIYITEYGPSYDVTYRPKAMVNGDNIGAAWNMAFLKAMLETGIDTAAYLVTTDIARKDKSTEQLNNVWGWCSYFVNPNAYGYPYPKAPYHTFKMVSELKGARVRLNRTAGNTDGIATVDQKRKTLQLLLWNYAADIPEGKSAIDRSAPETLTIKIRNAKKLFAGNPQMISKLIDAENGNIMRLRESKEPITMEAASPAITQHGVIKLRGDTLVITFTMPQSSVAMIEIGPNPTFSTPTIPYSEEAASLLQVGRQQMKDHDHGQAIKTFEKALAVSDAAAYQKSDALVKLLECATIRKDSKNILKTSRELMALKHAVPEHLSNALIAAAKQYRDQKKLDKSNVLCRKLLSFSFNRYDRMRAELCLGYNLMDQDNYDGAIKMFDQVHKQDYSGGHHFRVPAYLATAMCRVKQKDYKGAIDAYESVLEKGAGAETYQLFALTSMARCYFALGQPEKAQETLEKAGAFERKIPFSL
jgi:tetratricopeptide (TPR) repeat protein